MSAREDYGKNIVTGDELFRRAGEKLSGMRVREALHFYRLAEQARHDSSECAAGRWTCYMLAGEFERAWRESDAIVQRGTPDLNRFWDGLPFTGRRVMLRCLHGLGDTLQFVRYAPLIRRQARSLTIEAQPKLRPLLEHAGIADHVITWGETEPSWDQQVEVMELPYIFRTTVESIPRQVPYLQIAAGAGERQRDPSGSLQVGIVWAASRYNPARSIPIDAVAKLFDTPGVSFFSLQAGEEGSELERWAERIALLPSEYSGILATAKTIATLDLVITVDTMTAHLAGALACPVWTMLPHECDWRWMIGRADSPWYPTMRLFRQRKSDDWNAVIAEVQRELIALVAGRSAAQAGPARSRPAILVPEP